MTFTRLTLGEPRLRGRPKGGPVTEPCTEPLVTGEVLTDPGFELQADNFGQTEIARWRSHGGIRRFEWTDFSSVDPPDHPHWFLRGQGNEDRLWDYAQTNPRSGSWHVHSEVSGTGRVGALAPVRQFACGSEFYPWACRVTAGQVVDWSIWATTNDLTTARVEMMIGFHDETETLVEFFTASQSFTATGTYEFFSQSQVAPTNAYWVFLEAFPKHEGGTQIFDADDASLVIS